jgi:hypothetical protein
MGSDAFYPDEATSAYCVPGNPRVQHASEPGGRCHTA